MAIILMSSNLHCIQFQIVHRRLAARNILLNHLFEAKVAGFGPEPEEKLGINVNPIHVSNNIEITQLQNKATKFTFVFIDNQKLPRQQ